MVSQERLIRGLQSKSRLAEDSEKPSAQAFSPYNIGQDIEGLMYADGPVPVPSTATCWTLRALGKIRASLPLSLLTTRLCLGCQSLQTLLCPLLPSSLLLLTVKVKGS